MFIRTTTLGLYNQAVNQMTNSQEQGFDLQEKAANGYVKHMELSGYGLNSLSILNYQTANSQVSLYLGNNTQVQSLGDTYIQSLKNIQDAVDQAKKYLGSEHPLDPTSPEAKKFMDRINTLLQQVQNAANQKGPDGSYIFAGGHTSPGDPAPMGDLTSLPLYGTADLNQPFTPVQEPGVPTTTILGPPKVIYTYSNYGAPNHMDPIGWQQRSSMIDQDKTLSYGLSANDPGIQYAVDALMRIKSITNLGGNKDDIKTMVQNAEKELGKATDALTDMKTRLTFQLSQNKEALDRNTLFQHYITKNLASLTVMSNQKEVAGEIATAGKIFSESQNFMKTIFQTFNNLEQI